MKCVVVYFSQTGNTEKVAKAIQTGVEKAASHCDLLKIKEANPRRLYKYDLIGLGFPVIGGLKPGPVQVFIKNMRFVGGKHSFVFCTHGAIPDLIFPAIVPRLKRKGLIVIGTRDWYGDVYLLHMPEPYLTAGHPDEIDLKEAEDFGGDMVDRSRRISAGETELIPPVLKAKRPIPINNSNISISAFNLQDEFPSMLKYHKEKCLYPKCRLCMENCPMDGIDLTVNPPILAKPCINCEFCARVCPTGALDMDAWVKAMAAVTAKLLPLAMLPGLEKAEAEGRFRRLLPKDDNILSLDNFGYQKHKKHPMWIVGKGLNKQR